MTTKLAKHTSGRCLVPDVRLAPRNAFPTQLVDMLLTYLTLLYPPPGSYHKPVPASSIVLAGESTGSNLALGLIQIILNFHRKAQHDSNGHPLITFHGQQVPLPLPAGVAAISPCPDWNCALPSWKTNKEHDLYSGESHPALLPGFPTCSLWPSSPPREHFYCNGVMLGHPLVVPCLASDWTGAPPMWMMIGSKEAAMDGTRMLLKQLRKSNQAVLYEEYELMPHAFPMFFGQWWQAEQALVQCAEACQAFVEQHSKRKMMSRGLFWRLDRTIEEMDVDALCTLDVGEASEMIRDRADNMPILVGRIAAVAKASL